MKCHMNIIHEMPACFRIDLAHRVALGGERAGVERELAREPRLEVARARYNESVATYPAGSASDALRPRHGVGAERSKHTMRRVG
jgi:hypothetical protein